MNIIATSERCYIVVVKLFSSFLAALARHFHNSFQANIQQKKVRMAGADREYEFSFFLDVSQ